MAFRDALDLVRKVLPQGRDSEVAHSTSMGTLPKLVKEGGWRSIRCTNAPDVKVRTSRQRLVPYVDPLEDGKREIPMERIILGPGGQIRTLDPKIQEGHHVTLGVRRLLERQGPKKLIVPVEASAIPYDPS